MPRKLERLQKKPPLLPQQVFNLRAPAEVENQTPIYSEKG